MKTRTLRHDKTLSSCYMTCSFNFLNCNLKKSDKKNTEFVASVSYLINDQQKIQEYSAHTENVTVQKLTAFPTWLSKLQEITS